MASGSQSLNQVFGLVPSQTKDLGRQVSDAGAPVRLTTRNMPDKGGMLSVPVILAMGLLLWFALHE